jgi:hypothetical protein
MKKVGVPSTPLSVPLRKSSSRRQVLAMGEIVHKRLQVELKSRRVDQALHIEPILTGDQQIVHLPELPEPPGRFRTCPPRTALAWTAA